MSIATQHHQLHRIPRIEELENEISLVKKAIVKIKEKLFALNSYDEDYELTCEIFHYENRNLFKLKKMLKDVSCELLTNNSAHASRTLSGPEQAGSTEKRPIKKNNKKPNRNSKETKKRNACNNKVKYPALSNIKVKKKEIQRIHRLSGFNRRATFVQGGAPSLGKNR